MARLLGRGRRVRRGRFASDSRKTDEVGPVAQYCCISRLKIGEIEVLNYRNACSTILDLCHQL
jgi:hypothetical protein